MSRLPLTFLPASRSEFWGEFSSTWVPFVTTLPSVFNLLSSADELFFVCHFVCCRVFILFSPLWQMSTI